jgi:hypothetical protein
MGSIISGIGSLIGGQTASAASTKAADEQLTMYNQTRSDLLPYNTTGQNALTQAYNLASSGPTGGGTDYLGQAAANVPGTMTQSQLEQTPGYQWQMQQGLKAVQSAAASRGLGVSGASIKGGATYATNLADSNYETQFNNQQSRFTDYLNLNTGSQSNITNQFNRLNSLASLGENAAAVTGQYGTQAANYYGSYTQTAGQELGAGQAGLAKGVGSTVNDLTGYIAANAQTGGSG